MFGYSSIAAMFGLPLGPSAAVAPVAGSCEQGDGESCQGSMSGSATNPIMQALAQALESLGLTLSGGDAGGTSTSGSQSTSGTGTTSTSGTSAAGSGSTAATSNSPATSGTTTSGTTATSPATTSPAPVDDDEAPHRVTYHSIARDIRHLMHALFQDIRAEALLAPAPAAGAAATDATSGAANATTTAAQSSTSPFAAGLAALISQVSGGSVPANLQRAFDKLVADLQRLGGTAPAASTPAATGGSAPAASGTSTSGTSTSASGTGSTSTAGGAAAPSLLLKFLTTLQQDLGYGPAASTAGSTNGLLVNQVA
jgi:hypothetical protein